MRLKTHFARSGHIYQHEVKYIIINYLLNIFNVINYILHPEFTIKVLGTCTQVLLKVLVLVLKYFWKSSTCTCTCTHHFFKYLYLYSSTFDKYSPQAWDWVTFDGWVLSSWNARISPQFIWKKELGCQDMTSKTMTDSLKVSINDIRPHECRLIAVAANMDPMLV